MAIGTCRFSALGIGFFEACDVRMGKGQGSVMWWWYTKVYLYDIYIYVYNILCNYIWILDICIHKVLCNHIQCFFIFRISLVSLQKCIRATEDFELKVGRYIFGDPKIKITSFSHISWVRRHALHVFFFIFLKGETKGRKTSWESQPILPQKELGQRFLAFWRGL